MKLKISIYIASIFLFFFLSINIEAASWKFEWENQIVEIPVNDSLENYKNLPKASLYKNGIILPDANITYNMQGDWLCYLADVNTSKIGEYEVWYKAYDSKYKPGTCPGYKCKIKFVVYDSIKPELSLISDEINVRRNETFDPFSNVLIKDNYSKEFSVSYVSNIDLKTIGTYNVKVIVLDESSNKSEIEYKVNVYENVYPVITLKNTNLKFPLNSNPDLSGYFEAYDEIDGNLTNKIDYPIIDTSKIGIYEYEVSVKNYANLETKKAFSVSIIDDVMPTINLTKEKDILDYNTDFSKFDFKKYVLSITDNEPINYDNLTYTHNLLNKIGTYEVDFTYSDNTYKVLKTLTLELISFTKPEIICNTAYLKVGSYNDLYSYVEVVDESDDNCYLSLEIDTSDVDFYTTGSYFAHAYAINSSGMSKTVDFEVVILSDDEYEKLNNEKKVIESSFNPKDIIYIGIILILVLFIALYIIKEKVIKKSKN